ncbi:MAG: hypothetical protein RMI94_15480 [Bryobacterales bacterium]|nr:hypothetical protein [Bryobacterales bacterium]
MPAVAVALVGLADSRLHAGAWVQSRGGGLVIVSLYGYRAAERYSPDGSRQPLGPGGIFESLSVQFWAELGLSDRWTAILSGAAPRLRYEDPFYRAAATTLGDFQLGFRRALRSPDRGWQLAIQTLVKAPAYSQRIEPRPGNGQGDLEVSLLSGRSFPVAGRWGFLDAQGGYRIRWGRPSDQWRGELTFGLHLSSRLTLMGQGFAVRRRGPLPEVALGVNPLTEPAFDLYRAQASAIVRIAPSWRIQAGGLTDIAGRNIARGRGWMFALWKSF